MSVLGGAKQCGEQEWALGDDRRIETPSYNNITREDQMAVVYLVVRKFVLVLCPP